MQLPYVHIKRFCLRIVIKNNANYEKIVVFCLVPLIDIDLKFVIMINAQKINMGAKRFRRGCGNWSSESLSPSNVKSGKLN